jgi:hypothetical protein
MCRCKTEAKMIKPVHLLHNNSEQFNDLFTSLIFDQLQNL